jgi:carbon storage regulator
MLVVSRRVGQAIWIGATISVKVVRIEGDRVLLGVDASRDIPIVREELLQAVTDEVKSAAGAPTQVVELLRQRRQP